jgi:anti-anti-sigma factor
VPDSSFPVTRSDGLAVVTTPDEIDINNAGLLREALLAAAAGGQSVVIVDMTATEFCDSTGLNVLVRALKQAEEADTQLTLVVCASALRRMLTVSGVGGLFLTHDTLAEAVDAARAQRAAGRPGSKS